MYISKIRIQGFRNFTDNEILFTDGINVIVGHNNSGKTNLLRALSLVVGSQGAKRLCADDFHKFVTLECLQETPPEITITLTITQSEDETLYADDLATVGNWLIKLEPPYEAQLTYKYFLPEREHQKYKRCLARAIDINRAWQIIDAEFIRLFTSRIFGGNSNLQNSADSESLQKFDFQFLDAIRDVERDMFNGRNTLLKDVLTFFIDYNIKNDSNITKEEKEATISEKKDAFTNNASQLISELKARIGDGQEQILSYAAETGASFQGAKPTFDGNISEIDLFSALKLLVEYETGIKIPTTHNGLGYNNLIFMSLLLAKMQVDSDGNYLGSNAKVFPILAIEEPESHLHPSMQYKFLKFLRENKDVKKKVRQLFITTHSTQITSAVSLDELICMNEDNGRLGVGYPGKVFPDNVEGRKAKAYVERFLDATKSDMLFAKKVIFVEGLAEQLLLPILAQYREISIEDEHITIINVGGRCFDYFLQLFDSNKDFSIRKKIVCLTDRDPERKELSGSYYEKCYPFEFNQNTENYNYKDNATYKIQQYATHSNIRFFSQEVNKGKTFEYDLVLANPKLKLLVTESMKNRSEILKLIEYFEGNADISCFEERLRGSAENERIINSIALAVTFSDEEKKKAIIAARYLNSVEKGENALELAYCLKGNLDKENPEPFIVPAYITEALEWLCQ